MTKKQFFTYVMLVVGFGLAGYLVYNILREYTVSDIIESVAEIPTGHLVAALGYSAASYLCLTGFDWCGVRAIRNDDFYAITHPAALERVDARHEEIRAAFLKYPPTPPKTVEEIE